MEYEIRTNSFTLSTWAIIEAISLYMNKLKPGAKAVESGEGRGLDPPPIISICTRQRKTLRLQKCEPNLDLLKKMKEPRLALSMLLAHMLQAISDSLFSSILIDSFPNL